jgi:hypothetical protein
MSDNIAGLPVSNVKNNVVTIGNATVTKTELLSLVEKMSKVPPDKEFEITGGADDPMYGHINFTIRHAATGWIATAKEQESGAYDNGGYNNKSAHFCLTRSRAEKLLRFLAGKLGYTLTSTLNFTYSSFGLPQIYFPKV